jgi:hypothetical protein
MGKKYLVSRKATKRAGHSGPSPGILALESLRLKHHKFKANLGYIADPVSKNQELGM